MKKLILFSIILFLTNGACKEEEINPYKDFFGYYEGKTYARPVIDVYFCEGIDMEIKDLGGNNVTISVYCRTWAKESLNKFENLRIGKSSVDTIDASKWGSIKKRPVSYSLIDIKTNKEVAFIHKYPNYPYRIFADSLLSTKGVYLNLYFGEKK